MIVRSDEPLRGCCLAVAAGISAFLDIQTVGRWLYSRARVGISLVVHFEFRQSLCDLLREASTKWM